MVVVVAGPSLLCSPPPPQTFPLHLFSKGQDTCWHVLLQVAETGEHRFVEGVKALRMNGLLSFSATISTAPVSINR